MKARRNDEDRRLWVLNDEGLYRLQLASRLGVRAFIRRNRQVIDEIIDGVESGKHQSHYLVYGG